MKVILRLLLIVMGFLWLLAGCASFSDKPGTVIMQNPETMEFFNCEVDRWGTAQSYDRNEKCVEDYKKKGYVVWGER